MVEEVIKYEVHHQLVSDAMLEKTVKVLNELLEIDRDVMSKLICTRLPCAEGMGTHPTVIVGGEPLELGMLGVINAIMGYDRKLMTGRIAISTEIETPDRIESFVVVEPENKNNC